MSIVSIMLGIKPVELPVVKRNYSHLTKINAERTETALENLRRVLRDLVMSTSDISKRLGIERASAARYLADLEKKGIVERVGETVHPEDRARVGVWKFTQQFLMERK